MHRSIALAAVLAMAACSSPRLPPPNAAQAVFDRREGVEQVTVNSVVPPTGVFLVSASGARYQAPGLSLRTSLTTRHPPLA
jgi:hypothetical protein